MATASTSQPPQPRAAPPPPLTSSPYPFAAAPDIIRAHQKDAYFQGVLNNQLSDLHRRLRGARSAHAWAAETRTFADALYLCLTTLLGNRTLGEEYCDLVQVEAPRRARPRPHGKLAAIGSTAADDATATTQQQEVAAAAAAAVETATEEGGPGGPVLPSLARRAGYIATSVLLPYVGSRVLPRVRAAVRARLRARLATLTRQGRDETKTGQPGAEYRVVRYVLAHLNELTSGAHVRAAALAVFYFTGAYYSLSKRLFRLRYVFTRRIDGDAGGSGSGSGGRAGYEVLGVLLVVQMLVRAYLHVRRQFASVPAVTVGEDEEEDEYEGVRERGGFGPGATVDVSLDEAAFTSNNELLGGSSVGGSGQRSLAEIGATTHTPVARAGRARYDLGAGAQVMGWIKGAQQRKCTLCLEELRDPAATQCGHVFCWGCIGDWVREKPECPLCRREAMVQHILPLRAL